MPPEDDDAPTDYTPTELGAAIDETEAHKAGRWQASLPICHNCAAGG